MIIERKLKSGQPSYVARAYDINKAPYHKTFKDRTKALRWLDEQKEKLTQSRVQILRPTTTVENYFNYYLDRKKESLSRNSIMSYRSFLNQYIFPAFHGKKMIDITLDDIKSLSTSMAETGMGIDRNYSVISFVARVFKYASTSHKKQRVLARSPLNGVKIKSILSPNKGPDRKALLINKRIRQLTKEAKIIEYKVMRLCERLETLEVDTHSRKNK